MENKAHHRLSCKAVIYLSVCSTHFFFFNKHLLCTHYEPHFVGVHDGGWLSFYEKELQGREWSTDHLVYPPLGNFRQIYPKFNKFPSEENFNSCFGLLSRYLCPFLTETSTSKALATL